MCSLRPSPRRLRAEDVAHADGPDAAADAAEHEIFDVEAAIREEREARAELVDVGAAGLEQAGVGEAVGEGKGRLLHRRGSNRN